MEENLEKEILEIDDTIDYATTIIKSEKYYPCLFYKNKQDQKYYQIFRNNNCFNKFNFLYKNKVYNRDNFFDLVKILSQNTLFKQLKFVNGNTLDLDKTSQKYELSVTRTTQNEKLCYFEINITIDDRLHRLDYESMKDYAIKYKNKEYRKENFINLSLDLLCEFRAYEFIDINRVININGNKLNISTDNHNTYINFENTRKTSDNIFAKDGECFEVDLYAIGFHTCSEDDYDGFDDYDNLPGEHFVESFKTPLYEEYLKNNSEEKLCRDIKVYIKENNTNLSNDIKEYFSNFYGVNTFKYKAIAWFKGKKIEFDDFFGWYGI